MKKELGCAKNGPACGDEEEAGFETKIVPSPVIRDAAGKRVARYG